MTEWQIENETVTVADWDRALIDASNIDRLVDGESRQLIQGKAALRIVAEYGIAFYKSAHPGNLTDARLAVIIDRNVVYAAPSFNGLDGVFIAPYNPSTHGEWAMKFTKDDLWEFSNISARLEGWQFFGEMVNHGKRLRCS